MFWNRKKEPQQYVDPLKYNEIRFRKKMRKMKTMLSIELDKANLIRNRPMAVKSHVVVPTDILLELWNIADLVMEETPVED